MKFLVILPVINDYSLRFGLFLTLLRGLMSTAVYSDKKELKT